MCGAPAAILVFSMLYLCLAPKSAGRTVTSGPAAPGNGHSRSEPPIERNNRGLVPCADHTHRIEKALRIMRNAEDPPRRGVTGDDPAVRPGVISSDDYPAELTTRAEDDTSLTWTFLFYNDADFTNAYNPYSDFVTSAHSSQNVNVLMLEDRWFGPCRLWYIGKDRRPVVLQNWGEANMGHYNTLRKFIAYGKEHYPADRYLLALYDHGGGWMGACSDVTNNDWLSMLEISRALRATGGVDIIAFTAPCMMGALESVYQLRDLADVYIASQDLSGYAAWHGIMDDICGILDASSELTIAAIAKKIVRLVAQNPYWASQFFGGEEWITMSAVDAQKTRAVAHQVDVVSRYAAVHMAKLFDDLKPAARGAWKMGRNGELTVGERDLYHFAGKWAASVTDPFVADHLQMLLAALDDAVLAEYHGWAQTGANGLSIYFPQYKRDYYPSYASSNLDFAGNTGWDEFLNAFYGYDAKPVGSIAGTVVVEGAGMRDPLSGVAMCLYETQTGDYLHATATGADGCYEFSNVKTGDYTVEIVTPLGYRTEFEDCPVSITGGACAVVDIELARVDTAGKARGAGYWKHQTAMATGGGGDAQVDAETLCGLLDTIVEHFNGNVLNPVLVYDPPDAAGCPEKIAAARQVLMVSGAAPMARRARQHLMALLLNVAAANIAPYAVISEDGATVSRAITFCYGLLSDGENKNDVIAKDIAEMINESREVPAGMISPQTPDIAYAPVFRENETAQGYVLDQNYPNPFNPSTTIRFSLPDEARARLAVYDASGGMVMLVIDEILPAGEHTVPLNASALPSGVYFYRLASVYGVRTKKLVVVK